MQKSTIRLFNQLNQQFYQKVATEFSQTRNSAWQAWEKLIPWLQTQKQLRVLDVGCGNGRFLPFLHENYTGQLEYVGLDNSQALLHFAQKTFAADQSAQFQSFDFIAQFLQKGHILWPTSQKFDLIVAFGVTHHLPSTELRQEFFHSLANILAKNGLFCVSNWQFAAEPNRFSKNILTSQKIKKNSQITLWQKWHWQQLLRKLEQNDYLLDWRASGEEPHFRYCHFITASEMPALLQSTQLQIKKQFLSDGKSGQLNQYFFLS